MTATPDFRLIPIEEVICDGPKPRFSTEDLEALAQNILNTGGLLSPLVVTQTEIESYSLIDGELNYYAALRAQEIDPRAAEMVGVFVVEESHRELAKEQLSRLHPSTANVDDSSSDSKNLHELIMKMMKQVSSFSPGETSFSDQLDELRKVIQDQHLTIQNLNENLSQLGQQVSRLSQAVTQFEEKIQAIPSTTKKRTTKSAKKRTAKLEASDEVKAKVLSDFNDLSIEKLVASLVFPQKLKGGFRGKTLTNILELVDRERKLEPFESLEDLISRVSGLSDNRMQAILTLWSSKM